MTSCLLVLLPQPSGVSDGSEIPLQEKNGKSRRPPTVVRNGTQKGDQKFRSQKFTGQKKRKKKKKKYSGWGNTHHSSEPEEEYSYVH